jgi:hypothetical protein
MTDSTAITTVEQQQPAPLAFLHDGKAFDHLWRVAKAFSMSGMVPAHYQGKPEACMVALMYAEQLGEHPMLMFQEMGVFKGKPITSTRFAIARANKSGQLKGPIQWSSKGQGDALEVTAAAVLRDTGEKVSTTVTMREAIADGWTKNDKYRSIPEQMLRWRSATRLINLYIPEVLFGLGVREEVETVTVRGADVLPASNDVVAQLNDQIRATAETVEVLDERPAAIDAAPEATTTTPPAAQQVETVTVEEDPF